jgi:hypothetical protein
VTSLNASTRGIRASRRPELRVRVCRNRRCHETLAPMTTVPVCPSCRVAGAYGALLAGAVALIAGLIRLL